MTDVTIFITSHVNLSLGDIYLFCMLHIWLLSICRPKYVHFWDFRFSWQWLWKMQSCGMCSL